MCVSVDLPTQLNSPQQQRHALIERGQHHGQHDLVLVQAADGVEGEVADRLWGREREVRSEERRRESVMFTSPHTQQSLTHTHTHLEHDDAVVHDGDLGWWKGRESVSAVEAVRQPLTHARQPPPPADKARCFGLPKRGLALPPPPRGLCGSRLRQTKNKHSPSPRALTRAVLANTVFSKSDCWCTVDL